MIGRAWEFLLFCNLFFGLFSLGCSFLVGPLIVAAWIIHPSCSSVAMIPFGVMLSANTAHLFWMDFAEG